MEPGTSQASTMPNPLKRVSFSKTQLLVTAAVFALVGGYIILKTFAAEPALTHTNNTLVSFADDKKTYLIEDGKLRLVSKEVQESYGYTGEDVRAAAAGDERLPVGEPLEFAEGAIIKDSDKQYLTEKINGKLIKRLIEGSNLLNQLSAKSVTSVDVAPSLLPKESASPVTDTGLTQRHPNGTVVLSDTGVNYMILDGKKRLVNSYAAYKTNRIDKKLITAENEADKKLPISEPLDLREGSLVRGTQSIDYVLEKTKGKDGTLTKRPIRSDEVLLDLGYHKSEVIRIPDSEIQALPTGQPLPESTAAPISIIVLVKKGGDSKKLSEEFLKKGGEVDYLFSEWFGMIVPYEQIGEFKKDPRVSMVSGNSQLTYIPCDPGDNCSPAPSPPPPPPPPAPAPAPAPAPSPGGSAPTINRFIYNGGNNFTYNVSQATNCEVRTVNPAGGIQPFTPSLGGDYGISAGNGGSGTLYCWNNGAGPAVLDASGAQQAPPSSGGTPAPYINTWYFNGTNSWSYGVDNASRCEVHLSNGGIQPFTPSLGGVFPISAGNGGYDGQLYCWNGSVGPTIGSWAGPSGTPNPPAPSGQVAPSIISWAFVSGNNWSYRVTNSTYCEVKLTNNAVQPFTPTNNGTYTVSAGNGGMQGQLSCWNNSVGPAVSAMVGPTAPTPAPAPAPAPAPTSYPPLNDWPPTITGSANTGSTLTANAGTWKNGVTSFNYVWQRCTSVDSLGYPISSSCVNASPFSSNTYTVSSTDQGKRIAVRVTATNGAGSASVYSKATVVVPGSTAPAPTSYPPLNDWPPSISGIVGTGNTLTTDPGTWKNGVTTFAYAWQRCTSVDSAGYPVASSCVSASPFSSTTYSVSSTDQGKRIAVRVTATNGAGSASVYSKATVVVPVPVSTPTAQCGTPTNTTAPVLSGTFKVGQVISTSKGTWNANCTSALSYYYSWYRCTTSTSTSSCTFALLTLNGVSQYKLGTDDLNKYIRASVQACNSKACSALKYTAARGKVTSSSPAPAPTPVPLIVNLYSDNGTIIQSGSNLRLRWSSTGATSCKGTSTPVNSIWNNLSQVAGALEVGPVLSPTTKTITFNLKCSNATASLDATPLSITVQATPPPPSPPSPSSPLVPTYFTRIGWTNRGAAGQPVAVMDSGVNGNDTFLKNVVPGYNCFDNNTDTSDSYGHGTQVASVIAGTGDGLTTPLGVAPGTRIVSFKVTDSVGKGTTDKVAMCALSKIKEAGIKYVNISLVLKGLGNDDGDCDKNPLYRLTCDFTGRIIAAAGNENGGGLSQIWPATMPNVLAVTAMHDTDGKLPDSSSKDRQSPCGGADDAPAPYSAYADGNEASHTVSAPGCILINGKDSNGKDVLGYGAGVSLATPIVTGMAALCDCSPPKTNASSDYYNFVVGEKNYGPLVTF